MASAAKICKLLLAALLLVSPGTAAASNDGAGGCIRLVDEVSKLGSCKCYERCSDADKGGLMNAESQTCFVNCVLRHGCVCDGEVAVVDPPAVPPGGPRVVLSAPLVTTLRVNVTRPPMVVSKSRAEKEKWEEMLVVEFSVDPNYDLFGFYGLDMSIHYNCPEGGEPTQIEEWDPHPFSLLRMSPNPRYDTDDTTFSWSEKVIRVSIRRKLEYLRADGDETITVSFYPYLLSDKYVAREDAVDHYKRSGLTIEAVRIQYQPRA